MPNDTKEFLFVYWLNIKNRRVMYSLSEQKQCPTHFWSHHSERHTMQSTELISNCILDRPVLLDNFLMRLTIKHSWDKENLVQCFSKCHMHLLIWVFIKTADSQAMSVEILTQTVEVSKIILMQVVQGTYLEKE